MFNFYLFEFFEKFFMLFHFYLATTTKGPKVIDIRKIYEENFMFQNEED